MASTVVRTQGSRPLQGRSTRLYWVATGMFCFMFVFSGVWSIIDPDGARETMVRLGFPTYFLYPQAIAKLLGVAVILSRRWRTLTDIAFAGFLFDLLLAFGAHIAESDPQVWLAVFGLVLWCGAFSAYQWRYPAPPLR